MPPPPTAPLTGLPDPSGDSLKRPAASLKVENTPDARPQGGLDQADVVYEEVVEGGITRLVAIFNSHVPDVIGPVRSVRAMDPDIVWPLGGLFAFSGGTEDNVAGGAGRARERHHGEQPGHPRPQRAGAAAARRAAQPLRPRAAALRRRRPAGAAASRCSSTT